MRTSRLTSLVVVVMVAAASAVVVPTLSARAATSYQWNTALHVDQRWGNANNWIPQGVPGAGDSVVIADDATHQSNVTNAPTVQLQSLSIQGNGGSGAGVEGGHITIAGSFSITGTTSLQTLKMTINAGATAAFSGQTGAAPTLLGGVTITNNGTMTFQGTESVLDYAGDDQLINNATTQVQIGSSLAGNQCCSNTGGFFNHGVVSLTSGTGTTTTFNDIAFNNSATLTIPSGQTVQLIEHPSAVASGALVTGGGRLLMFDATQTALLTLGANLALGAGTTFELGDTATMDGGGHDITGSGGFVWDGGFVTGALTVEPTVPFSMTTTSVKTLTSGSLTTQGTTSFSAGDLHLDAANVTNSGMFTVTNGAHFDANTACCVYVNNGTLNVAAEGSTPTFSNVDVTNNGTLYPGAAATPGLTTMPGLTETKTGTLSVDISSPSSFDRVAVVNTAHLAGALVISTMSGFQPAVGTSFTVMTWSGHAGKFKAISGTYLRPGAVYAVIYTASGLKLTVVKQSIALSPTSGTAGSTVKVTGTGFAAGESVTVKITDHAGVVTFFPAVTATASGGFTATITIPAGSATGSAKVTATGGTSGLVATKTYKVT
jgi:hypothetical protein